MNHLPKQQCYITLKDNKKDFASNPKTRLINPSYSDIGQISKCIVDKINIIVRKSNFDGELPKRLLIGMKRLENTSTSS